MFLFRETDEFGVLKKLIYAPKNYRLEDAKALKHHMDSQLKPKQEMDSGIELEPEMDSGIELEQEMDTDNYFNEGSNSSGVYDSFSQPSSQKFEHYSSVTIYAKPSIIGDLTGQINRKQNKHLCNIYM